MAADWFGWIIASGEDRRRELEAMGVKVGPWVPKLSIFSRCELSGEAFVRLMKFRGRFLWKLSRPKPRRRLDNTR